MIKILVTNCVDTDTSNERKKQSQLVRMAKNPQEVVFEGWLTKSPPTKRIWRAVRFFVYYYSHKCWFVSFMNHYLINMIHTSR